MVLSLLGGQRRARLLLITFFATTILFYLVYQLGDDVRLDGFNRGGPANTGGSSSNTAVDGAADNSKTTSTTGNDAADGAADTSPAATCIDFQTWMGSKPDPKSEGKREFPYMRPTPECRTFRLPALEKLIERMKSVIKDPDLYRLFENSYPITLDTMVKWRGYANKTNPETFETEVTDEELTYVITGDIDAMWLRDSASQIYSYLPLLEPSTDPDSLASLWRGLINSHARYITISPYCHSFQPPAESGISPTVNGAYRQNNPNPPYDPQKVFDCKWELDSLASFLQISSAYYKATGDVKFFGRYSWVSAVIAALKAAGDMRLGTYGKDGKVLPSAWTFTGYTNRGSETLTNDGLGNPIKENGMVRTAFRPSDDACIYQFLTPANMMWAKYLEEASEIMEKLDIGQAANLTAEMRAHAAGIREGIDRDAIVVHRDFGEIFAYEVDGFGSTNMMDDANVPSLLAMPLWNYSIPVSGSTPAPAAKQQPVKEIVKSERPTHSNSTKRADKEEEEGSAASAASVEAASTGTAEASAASAASASAETTKAAEAKESAKATKSEETDAETTAEAAAAAAAETTTTNAQKTRDYDLIYRNTRAFVLSEANPYYAWGPALSAVGGPHLGPGKGWPMAAIIASLTAYSPATGLDDPREEVAKQLRMVLDSTAGMGVVHETVNSWNEHDWTRPWFGWANGLLGELIIRIEEEDKRRGYTGEESLLGRSWQ